MIRCALLGLLALVGGCRSPDVDATRAGGALAADDGRDVSPTVAAETSVPQEVPAFAATFTGDDWRLWRDHIAPGPGELAWTDIPWEPTFAEGLAAAREAGRPVLFWAMNGHPLGCT